MPSNLVTRTLAAALAVATFAGAAISVSPAAAQPRPYRGAGYNGPPRYYYNGRWVDQRAWESRRDREWRDRRYRRYHNDSGDAVAAGIIGFALGAAILGSQSDSSAAYERRTDRRHVASCRATYKSYDSGSDTFMGNDGYRHYCTL